MNLVKIKNFTLINIRLSTIAILICYFYLIATDFDIYSPIASLIIYIVPMLLVFILINLIFLIVTIIKNKKTNKT